MMLQLMLLTTTFSQQKVQTLTRCHIMRSLIWVHTVCIMSHLWDTLPFLQIVQAPIRRHMYKEWNGFRHKHKVLSVFCAVLLRNVGQNIPGQNIPCHFLPPRTKHPASICHPGQNIPCSFCHPGQNIPCHFCCPRQNIPCYFCHPGQNIPHSV